MTSTLQQEYDNELNALITAFRKCQRREPNSNELQQLEDAAKDWLGVN